ncbi:MAG: hypothetical protein FWE53_01160 [Firmicutes bacterium]|nr:hypothetical protein [Bacillota bacterium]
MQGLDELLKTNAVYDKLLRVLNSKGSIPHAFLLYGSDEAALTALAELTAKSIMCGCGACNTCLKVDKKVHTDVMYYPKGDKAFLVEDALEVTDSMYTLPYEGGKKVYILNFGANANQQSQNKLLKSLEEPARDVVFIITSTNIASVLATIKSRTTKFAVAAFERNALKKFVTVNFASTNAELISEVSGGKVTNAIKYATDSGFEARLKLVFGLLTELTHSSKMIGYLEQLNKEKSRFGEVLELFSAVVGGAINSPSSKGWMSSDSEDRRGSQTESLQNIHPATPWHPSNLEGNYRAQYSSILSAFGLLGLSQLVKLTTEVQERIVRNSNFNATLDYFLLKILEVRFNANFSSIG